MNDGFAVSFLILLTVAILILIAAIAVFWKKFTERVRYICRNMECADSYNEYRYWRRELRCHYLTLIPFVGERNVKDVYRFFYKGRRNEQEERRRDGLVPMLLPSVLSIGVCMICICGMTWAWFSASVSGGTSTIKAAHYEIAVEVSKEESVNEAENENEAENVILPVNMNDGGSYTLEAGTYTVVLTAQGDASTGYCKIIVGDEELHTDLHTDQIYTDDSGTQPNTLQFTIKVSGVTNATISFVPVWGTYSDKTTEVHENSIVEIAKDGTVAVKDGEPVVSPDNETE